MDPRLYLRAKQVQGQANAQRNPRAQAVMNGFGAAESITYTNTTWYDESLAYDPNFKKWAYANGFTPTAYGNCWYKIAFDYANARGLPISTIKSGVALQQGLNGITLAERKRVPQPLGARQFDPTANARGPAAVPGHPYLTIPDSRWVNAGLQGFGFEPGDTLSVPPTFCYALKPAMNELGASLEKAFALGLQGELKVRQAVNVWDSNSNFFDRVWITNPFGDSCEDMVREVTQATASVNSLLGANAPAASRPDYDPNKDAGTGLKWLPWAIGGVVALYALTLVSPYIPKPKKA